MPVPAPPICTKSFDQIVAQTESLMRQYAKWQPAADGEDPCRALIRVFAHLAQVVIERLNRAPDKNFLAFLNLIGVELLPPLPARVPLTFYLAAGTSTDVVVPMRTQVAASPIDGDTGAVVFETERDLTVTRSPLVAAFSCEPARDRYSDNTELATGRQQGNFSAFRGDSAVPHVLYLGDSSLFGLEAVKTVALRFRPVDSDPSWLYAVEWSYLDGGEQMPLVASVSNLSKAARPPQYEVTLKDVPAVPATSLAGKISSWLCGRLRTPLPPGKLTAAESSTQMEFKRESLVPERGFAGGLPLDLNQSFSPFGRGDQAAVFLLACEEAFSKPGATVELAIELNGSRPATASEDLVLSWQYWDGKEFTELGRSSPSSESAAESVAGFADETRAFTATGSVSFRSPAAWAESTENEIAGYWLRICIDDGEYSATTGDGRPFVERLTVSYEWRLPRIEGIDATVKVQRNELSPDFAFFNQALVDFTKDFYPFGERPKFSDTFYLGSQEVFGKPTPALAEYKVTMHVVATQLPVELRPDQKHPVQLTWEYWNGSQWMKIGSSSNTSAFIEGSADYDSSFADESQAFTIREIGNSPPAVRFTVPRDWQTRQINNQMNYWLRVRISGGDYGTDVVYQPATDANNSPIYYDDTKEPLYRRTSGELRAPSLRSITLSYIYTTGPSPPEHVRSENDFVVADHSGAIQTVGEMFNPFVPRVDPRSALYLGFERAGSSTGFDNRSTTLYLAIAEIPYEGAGGPSAAPTEPPSVVWEYWGGTQWRRLGTRDETQNLSVRGLVEFVGPVDFLESTEFGRKAFWLRACLQSGTYPADPMLRRVLTNTTWATNSTVLQDEILGSSNGQPGQIFRTARAPVLSGQSIEIREPRLSATERTVMEQEEGDDAVHDSDVSGEVWVRWHPVPDFNESGPQSRHYMIDRLSGEIRFGDGKRGLVPQRGRANINAARYRTGGGLQGNRPERSITQLKTAIPHVDQVTNWEPAGGGSSSEDLEAVKVRGPKTLRHRNRAVTISDFEDLVFDASAEVARVKGLATRESMDAGLVELIVVPRSAGDQPIPSLELLAQVRMRIEESLTPTVDLRVSGPDWLRVSVSAEVVPSSPEKASDVQAAVVARLAEFLNPLTGGLDHNGWEFGRKPHRSDIYVTIEATPGVDHVYHLELSESGQIRPDRFLVCSGEHQITMRSMSVD